MKKIIFTTSFQKSFDAMNVLIQNSVVEKLELLSQNNDVLDIKKMEPKHMGLWRLRIGKYRVIYEYLDSGDIRLLKIDSRDRIYR